MTDTVAVAVHDLRVAEQKAARLEADLYDGGVSFQKLIGDAKTLILSVRILTTEHLPAQPEKELTQ